MLRTSELPSQMAPPDGIDHNPHVGQIGKVFSCVIGKNAILAAFCQNEYTTVDPFTLLFIILRLCAPSGIPFGAIQEFLKVVGCQGNQPNRFAF